MREILERYVKWLYSKEYNSIATAIKEDLDGCTTEYSLQQLWNDTESMRNRDKFL